MQDDLNPKFKSMDIKMTALNLTFGADILSNRTLYFQLRIMIFVLLKFLWKNESPHYF